MSKSIEEFMDEVVDFVEEIPDRSAWWLLVLFVAIALPFCRFATLSVTSAHPEDLAPIPADAPCVESAILPDAASRFDCAPGAQVAVNRPGEGERPDDGPAFLCLCPAMDEIDEAVVGLEVEVTP